MPKQIVKQTFEQIIQEPGKMAETAAQQTGLKTDSGSEQPQQSKPFDPVQVAKREAQRRMMLAAHTAELADIKRQQTQELPKQISGKPGFSEEKAIKQLKEQQKQNPPAGGLPPVIAAAKKKGGTGERRLMGGSS